MNKSPVVCSRCGLPVRSWIDGWKHSAGAHSKSCGRPPDPIARTEYEARIARAVSEALKK